MISPGKRDILRVGDFLQRHGESLQLRQLNGEVGHEREIPEPSINRPGLALAGYFSYFAHRRIQVLGSAEISYLRGLPADRRRLRLDELMKRQIPALVVSRGMDIAEDIVGSTSEASIPLLRTQLVTMEFTNQATIKLESEFAPRTTVHGCMIDVGGIGILVRGPSGSGKSEAVLCLLERGWSLVSDDLVRLRRTGDEIVARSPELGFGHMEVRGLGIINPSALYGVGTIRLEKRLDLIVDLVPADQLHELERVGVVPSHDEVLGLKIPKVQLAVAPGRDVARLIEVAALNQKLRSYGHDTAVEFNRRLLETMRRDTIR